MDVRLPDEIAHRQSNPPRKCCRSSTRALGRNDTHTNASSFHLQKKRLLMLHLSFTRGQGEGSRKRMPYPPPPPTRLQLVTAPV